MWNTPTVSIRFSGNISRIWLPLLKRRLLDVYKRQQKLIEEQHNQRVDTIAAKKQKGELYTVSMATMKELYKMCIRDSR